MKYYLLFIFCSFFIVKVKAQTEIYVCCSDKSIRKIDLSNCSSQICCYTNVELNDIAINPISHEFYGITSQGDFGKINLNTGSITFIGQLGLMNALTFDNNGILYAMTSSGDALFTVDLTSGMYTILGSTNTGISSAGDLTFYKGYLYLAGIPNQLVKIDPNNLYNSTIIGSFLTDVFGLSSVGCQPEIFASTGNSIFKLDSTNLLQYTPQCLNIVGNNEIYGSASLTENFYLPQLNLGEDTTLCSGEVLTLDVNSPISTNYLWSDNSINSSVDIYQSGNYWVEVSYYCNNSKSDTINVNFDPSPIFSLKNDTTICNKEVLTLDATTTNASYLWQNNSTNPTLYIEQQGSYWVQVTVDNCTSADTVKVIVENCDEIELVIPNVFTPNYDGYNDLFTPSISKGITSINTSIYNRWGQLIFDSKFLNIGWDGRTTSGIEVPAGTYYWIINYSDINGDENKIKGYLTLLR